MSKNPTGPCTESLVKAQSHYSNQAAMLVWKNTSFCACCAVSAVFLTPHSCRHNQTPQGNAVWRQKGQGAGSRTGTGSAVVSSTASSGTERSLTTFLLFSFHPHPITTCTNTCTCTLHTHIYLGLHTLCTTHTQKADRCSFWTNTEVGSGEGQGEGQSTKLAPLWFGDSIPFPM